MRLLTVAFLSTILFGCGQATFTGTFIGNTSPGGLLHSQAEQLTFALTQNGNTVTGQMSSNLGGSGQVNAQVSGTTVVSMSIVSSSAGGSCTMAGSGSYSNYTLNLTIVPQLGCSSSNNSQVAGSYIKASY